VNVERGQDRCSECKTPLPDEGAYPDCASAKRFVSLSASIDVPPAKVTVDLDLIIGWQEVDRLVDKAEYGAALLVAAINVQFVRHDTPATTPAEAPHDESLTASDSLVCAITNVRNKIAHERGYFALLTQLRDPSWPEARIRQVLEDARAFCHGNAA